MVNQVEVEEQHWNATLTAGVTDQAMSAGDPLTAGVAGDDSTIAFPFPDNVQ